MRLLTLNINMFNYQIDNSFYDYLHDINPDLAIIQEARFNRLNDKIYSTKFPKGCDNDKIDSRVHLTVAFYKKSWTRDDDADFKTYNYSHIRLKKNECVVLGVHTPKIKIGEYGIEFFEKRYDADIVCGDLNASSRNKDLNYELYQKLIGNGYYDLWEESLRNKKAHYYNYRGEKMPADEKEFFRTYMGNTHIDYVLGKSDMEIKEIIIDYRTLAFTDHTGIIIDVEKSKCDSSF